MKELRRKDRAVTKEEAIALLSKAEYGVLSTVSNGGQPYGVPLNFCIINHCLFFHCAIEGQKIDNIRQNELVSFCVVGKTRILPDKFSLKYESVIVFGVIEEVFDANKQIALEGLLAKYSPSFIKEGKKYIEELDNKTRVFKITITNLTGKARK